MGLLYQLPITLDEPGIASTSNTVYIVGGYGATNYNSVYYASAAGGALGTWHATNAFPTRTDDSSCVTGPNNYLYCIGNAAGQDNVNIYYAKILSNGALGAWSTSAQQYPYSGPQDMSCVTSAGYVYCIGGRDHSGTIYSSAYSAQILPSNDLGAWTATTSYPYPLFEGSCVASGSGIFCIDGYDGSTTTAT